MAYHGYWELFNVVMRLLHSTTETAITLLFKFISSFRSSECLFEFGFNFIKLILSLIKFGKLIEETNKKSS